MNESIYYRETLDSLSKASLAALVDLSEGVFIGLIDPWIVNGLHKRGLTKTFQELFEEGHSVGMEMWLFDPLTDYGHAFIAWYRQPHEPSPQQLDLFGDEP